jgi:hypothetical protein
VSEHYVLGEQNRRTPVSVWGGSRRALFTQSRRRKILRSSYPGYYIDPHHQPTNRL